MAKTKAVLIEEKPKSGAKLAESLKKIGVSVTITTNDLQAVLTKIKSKNPDAVFHIATDLNSAINFRSQLRKYVDTPYILAISNKHTNAIKKTDLKKYIDYLTMPFEKGELAAVVEFATCKTAFSQSKNRLAKIGASETPEFAVLENLTTGLINNRGVGDALSIILSQSAKMLDASYVDVDLIEKEDTLVAYIVSEGQPLKRGDSVTRAEGAHLSWKAIDTKQPAIVNDYSHWALRRKQFDDVGYKAVMVTPILKDHRAIGVVDFSRTGDNKPFTQYEAAMAEKIAQVVALLLENVDLQSQLETQSLQNDIARQNLQLSEDRFQSLSEAAFEGLVIHEGGIILTANQKFAELCGLDKITDVNGKKLLDILPITEHSRGVIQGSARKSRATVEEIEIVRNDGSTFSAETQGRDINYQGRQARVVAIRDITARKEAETALRSAEADYRAIFEQAPVGIFRSSPSGRFLKVNDTMAEIYGYESPEAMIHEVKSIAEEIYPNPSDRQKFQSAIAGEGQVKSLLFQNKRRDGSLIWTSTTARAVKDSKDEVAYYEGFIIDVSNQKASDDALRESETKLRALFETMTEGVALNEVIYDENGEMVDYRILEVNPAFYTLADYHENTVIGARATQLYGMSSEFIKEFWKEHKKANKVQHSEMKSPISGKYYYISTSPFKDDKFVTSFFDVTERRRAEEALEVSEARFRGLSQASFEGVLIHERGVILDANQEMANLFGFASPQEMIGKNGFEILPMTPQSREIIKKKSGDSRSGVDELEILRKDGTTFPAETQGRSINFMGHEARVVTMRDITDRKMAEEKLRLYLRAVESASEGILITDNSRPDNPIIFVNAGFTKITGYDSSEVMGKNCRFLQGKDTDRRIVAQIRESLQKKSHFEGEILNYKKDGSSFWNFLSISPILDHNGNHTHFIGIQADITQQKRLDEKLRESESNYKTLFEFAPVALFTKDREGRYTGRNAENRKYWSDPSLGLTDYDILPEALANGVREQDNRIMQHAGTETFEQRVSTELGERTFLTRKTVLRNGVGETIGLLGASVDITESKQVEDRLRENEQNYRNLFEVEQHHARELELLDKVRSTVARELDEKTLIHNVVETIASTFGYSNVSLYLLENNELHLQHQIGYDYTIETIPITGGVAGRVIRTGKAELIEDVTQDSDFLGAIQDLTSEVCVPLFDKDGPIGIINLESKGGAKLTQQDLQLIVVLSEYVNVAIERARLFANVEEKGKYLSLLNDLTRTIILSGDFDEMIQTVANEMTRFLHADGCYITGWDEIQKRTIRLATSAKLDEPYRGSREPSNERTLTHTLMELERVLAVDDVMNTPYMSRKIASQYPAKSVLGIPLIFGRNKIGAVLIAFNTLHTFSEKEVEEAKQAGDQIALALWNVQQSAEIRKRLKESEALTNISLALSETERIGRADVLQLIADSAKHLIGGVEQVVIHLIDHESNILIPEAISGYEAPTEGKQKMRVNEGIAGQVLMTGEVINIPDVTQDQRFIKLNPNSKLRSLIVAPITAGQNKLGTISVQSSKPSLFSLYENRLLKDLGTQAAIAIENAYLLESTQKALSETNALYHVNKGLVSLDTNELLDDVVNLLQQNFDYYYVQIFLRDPTNGDLILQAGSGETGKYLKEYKRRHPAGEGIVGYVAETGKPFLTNDVNNVVFFVGNPILPNTTAELAVPIKLQNEVTGVLDIHLHKEGKFTPRDEQLLSTVADQISVALQKARLYSDLQAALEIEKTIRKQLAQNERLAIMGRLLASVSHELNNPLQAIQNALFLLKEEQGLSDLGRQDLEIVLGEAERMASMIERLRTTYRPTQREDFRKTQLNNLIQDVHALIATHLRHNQIAFEFHPDPALPVIPLISDQMRQVILNLFMNATEAMQSGGVIHVATSYNHDTNEVFLEVSDTGKGIAPSVLPHIFDAFVTDKETGTGLGLTISYDIVVKHRGRITAENKKDHGAVFKIWLPTDNPETE